MFWLALLLGIVEGITEFLPISSTGHLILVSHLAGLRGSRAEAFEISIQLGAVLAVVWEYRRRLGEAAWGWALRPGARRLPVSLAVAFIPAAVVGFLFHEAITEQLFNPRAVAVALVAGALLILLVEGLPLKPRTLAAESVGPSQALAIGLVQCVALWPGFSRSAATILGGLVVGLDRRAATEFSFFLAVPTLGVATVYSLLKNLEHLEPGDLAWLGFALLVSFLVAWASIRWLLRFVTSHTLRPFAWYRIALAAAVVVFLYRS